MSEKIKFFSYFLLASVFFCVPSTSNALEKELIDWDIIWQQPMPTPQTIKVSELGGLGQDLENREWQVVSTQYHQIYYQPSTDITKLSNVYSLVDNIYTFLDSRSPNNPQTPIKVFIVPGQKGQSRCSQKANAMRTGDQGDQVFMLTSLLHEETHLFNFAFLDNTPQGWWTGEYTCQYYQQRALWQAQGKNIKNEITSSLRNGPRCKLEQIDKHGKKAFDEAISALYFFEQQYGCDKSNRFRLACLENSRKTNGGNLPASVFEEVFGRDVNYLQQQWLRFYGWDSPKRLIHSGATDPRLQKKITYSVNKASVQNVVKSMAEKASLGYDWNKSQMQTDPLCRNWVRNLRISNQPLDEALRTVLDPVGLMYKLERNAIVLYKKR
ncbi:MAG: STN domain-containing protein [Planctomycetota bacterium]|jgi:hypothetical protein